LLNKHDVIDRLVGSLQVDITHTKETLDWRPPYSLEEGFGKCVKNKNGKKRAAHLFNKSKI
jgi:nucleoside-diphosphate-sugar epimerase